jgi:hypothetical protein
MYKFFLMSALSVIHANQCRPLATIGLHSTSRVAAAHKSFNKRTEQERMAAHVSEMLEEGDVKVAVRLAASHEKTAPYSNNAVDALIGKHPRAVYPPQNTANDEVKPLQ